MPDNEPAEDRSVRGNTIKPAKVEPEQKVNREDIQPPNVELLNKSDAVTANSQVTIVFTDAITGDRKVTGVEVFGTSGDPSINTNFSGRRINPGLENDVEVKVSNANSSFYPINVNVYIFDPNP